MAELGDRAFAGTLQGSSPYLNTPMETQPASLAGLGCFRDGHRAALLGNTTICMAQPSPAPSVSISQGTRLGSASPRLSWLQAPPRPLPSPFSGLLFEPEEPGVFVKHTAVIRETAALIGLEGP